MKSSVVILATILLGTTTLQPANAAGLLGGVSSAASSALGGSASTGGVGVAGVATANTSSDSSGTNVNGTVLGGGGNTINAGLSSVLGSNSNVAVALPGTDNSTLDGALGDTTDTVNGATENGGTVGTLLGDTGLSGPQGGIGNALGSDGGLLGTDNGDGSGIGNDGAGLGGSPGDGSAFGSDSRGSMAGLFGPAANSPACRQNTAVLAQLLRTPYSAGTARSWAHVSGIQMVKVPVCARIKGALGRAVAKSENIGRMQQMAEADPLIGASLARSRVAARHVLGVGQGKNGVTVYVY